MPVREVGDFLVQKRVLFYVIGDFSVHWVRDHDALLDGIANLICYDTDVILNLDQQPSKKQVCLFTSNTYNTLLASIKDRRDKKGVFDCIYVCSDPKGVMLSKKREREGDILDFNMVGVFKTTAEVFFPLENIPSVGEFEFVFPPRGRVMNGYKIYGFEL